MRWGRSLHLWMRVGPSSLLLLLLLLEIVCKVLGGRFFSNDLEQSKIWELRLHWFCLFLSCLVLCFGVFKMGINGVCTLESARWGGIALCFPFWSGNLWT